MAKARWCAGLMAGSLLGWVGATAQAAAPAVAQMLGFQPRQQGVVCTTPNPQEQASCKVELVTGAAKGSTGWLLRDARGMPLRRYFDSNGDKKVDVWSYYLDGAEVYREIDTNLNDKPDQYRWLNAGGMKWGLDANEDGKIDSWKQISADEVSQEVLQAIIKRDLGRWQALLITEAELKGLQLADKDTQRITKARTDSTAKFQATVGKLSNLNDKTKWVRLDSDVPQCISADQSGAKQDVIHYTYGTILYEHDGKHDFIQTGELIQVGLCWRLVEAPTPGAHMTGSGEGPVAVDADVQKLLDELHAKDAKAPPGQEVAGPNADVQRFHLERAEIIQRIIARSKPADQETFIRQLAEAYSAAAQSSQPKDNAAYEKLSQLAQKLAKEQPGSALAGYVAYREISADYAAKLAAGEDFGKVQGQYLERLTQFVQAYPKVDDTAEAIFQLGMVSEFLNKETEAKNWYNQFLKDFSTHPYAAKIQGATRRLALEGTVMDIKGPKLGGGAFDLAQLRGKLVIVYYWASWNQQCVGDFARLKLLLSTYASKGVELVCINVDPNPPEADSPIAKQQVPGVQIFQPGGLDSPLATQYGIMALPSMFLVGKDGKVLNRNLQVATLEDEIKKQAK